MKIRKAKISDAKKISDMMTNNINLVTSKKYSKEQILAMKEYASEKNIKKYIKNKKWEVFVAIEKNKIIWTITFEGNLVFSPYVASSKNFVKDPMGSKMLKFAETKLKRIGESSIKIISIETTKNYFQKKGYRVIKKMILGNEIKFKEFMMEKKLK